MPDKPVVFATPRSPQFSDCYFYHRMTLPDVGEVGEEWDLNASVDAYLGHSNFAGKRVLEIGPASGFLTAHMERAGAEVVCVDLPVDYAWDFVPRLDIGEEYRARRRAKMERLHNGFWFTHSKLGLKSKVIYSRVEDLPDSIGKFDIAVVAAVLIHSRDPMGILSRCGQLTTGRIVVTEAVWKTLETVHPIMLLRPQPDNNIMDSWWDIPPRTIATMYQIMGFSNILYAEYPVFFWQNKHDVKTYTIVGERQQDQQAHSTE